MSATSGLILQSNGQLDELHLHRGLLRARLVDLRAPLLHELMQPLDRSLDDRLDDQIASKGTLALSGRSCLACYRSQLTAQQTSSREPPAAYPVYSGRRSRRGSRLKVVVESWRGFERGTS